jgi:hypothetical protein
MRSIKMAFDIDNNGNIYLKQGDSDVLEFSFADDTGNPVNITGTTLYFSVKSSVDDVDYFFQRIVTNHINAENGLTEVQINSSNTNTTGSYFYDCVLVFADGSRDSFLPEMKTKTGKFIISKGVTNV